MRLFRKNKRVVGESISHLKSGAEIEIAECGKKPAIVHLSKLESHISEDELLIYVPVRDRKIIKIGINKEIIVTLKTMVGLYQNKAKVVKYEIINNIPFMRILLLQETVKIQRRASFRLKNTIEFNFDVVDSTSDAMLNCENVLLLHGLSMDISNGGIKFLSNEDLEKGSIIKVFIPINGRSISIIAVVLFKEYTENIDDYTYCYKCKFENINILDKEHISAYIFEEQRTLSRKGKLSKDEK